MVDYPGQKDRPPQHQDRQPGREHEMVPEPVYIRSDYRGSGKLTGKIALITGGDSGIGRAVAVHFAREGASVAIVYLEEDRDASETLRLVEEEGQKGILIAGDVGEKAFAEEAVHKTLETFGHLDILVNNAAEQHVQQELEQISVDQLHKTFRTNVFSGFYFSQAALPHLGKDAVIINSTSVTAYRGSDHLIDYASTKGAQVAFTRSLAKAVAERGIRVNAVAPGPVWTPLIPASFPAERVAGFGEKTLLGRAAQPADIAPCYVLLASDDGAFLIGQVLHPNGGEYMSS